MRLESFRLYRYSLPLVRPLHLAGGALNERRGLIVALRATDGAVGFGEIAPLPGASIEDLDSATGRSVDLLEQIGRRAVLGHGENARVRGRESMPASLRFGIETALLGMVANRNGDYLCNVLSPSPRPSVAINALLIGTGDDLIEDARRCADQGFRALKLKVGFCPPSETLRLLDRLCARIPDSITVRLDANCGWEFDDALAVASHARDFPIEYIEEPLRDASRLVELFEKTGLPYALDETLRSAHRDVLLESNSALDLENPVENADAESLRALLRHARAWIVKPSLLGLSPTEIALSLPFTSFSAKIVVSSAFESGLGLVALANIAACVNDEDVPAGLHTYRWFQNDLLRAPLPIEAGSLDLERANAILAAFAPHDLELVTQG